MGAAVGLLVDRSDLDDPDRIDEFRDQVHLGADQVGIRQSLFARQEAHGHLVPLGECRVERRLHLLAQLDADRLELEVHSSRSGLHVPAGHLGTEVPPND